jgi:GTP-binding protein
MLNHAQMLFKQARSRVSTPELNNLIKAALEHNPPPVDRHRRPKIYYGTQISTEPPTLLLFCNNPKSFSAQYRRYLLGVFRDQLSFGEVPIKLYLRRRESSDRDEEES